MLRPLGAAPARADNRGVPSPSGTAGAAPLSRPAPRVVLADDDVLLREGLALMAEGASNAGIARWIYVTGGTVEKYVRSILTKLNLPETDTGHRRVLAVLRFLEAR